LELDLGNVGHVEKREVFDAGEGHVGQDEDHEARKVGEKEGLKEKGKLLLCLLRFIQY